MSRYLHLHRRIPYCGLLPRQCKVSIPFTIHTVQELIRPVCSNQCCIKQSCSAPSGAGICKNTGYGCSGGTFVAGYCPGPTDVQCCVAQSCNTPVGTPLCPIIHRIYSSPHHHRTEADIASPPAAVPPSARPDIVLATPSKSAPRV